MNIYGKIKVVQMKFKNFSLYVMQIIPVAIIILIIWIRILLTEIPVWQHVSDHINRQLNSTINLSCASAC